MSNALLDNLSTGILALDDRLRVTALNVAGQAILDTSETRSLGRHASNLVFDSSAWLEKLEQALNSNAAQTSRSVALTLASGAQVVVDIITTPVRENEKITGVLVELSTVDRLLKISHDAHLANANETTRTVIRGLAHEIKNPLGGVRGAAQLLARELPNKELAEYTGIIIREADRLRDLVDRLLGPNQQLDQQPLNIHRVLEQVRELISAESGNQVRITRDYDPSLPELVGDQAQLVQAVLNVMRNALQAAADPKDCKITLRSRSQRQFTMAARRHRIVCRIDIVDNGPGIPDELADAIFAPMITGRADGTGLGLSIAQSIITQHGGMISCETEPGNTTFSIYLPLETQHASTS